MKKTQLALIGLVLAMVFGLTNPAYGGTLVLDVMADVGTLDFAPGATGGAFYIAGEIFEHDTTNSIGTFQCWGWDITGAGVFTVVSQEFALDGRGKIQTQGVEDEGPRAVVGGTGKFRNVRGEATGADLSAFPFFTITFKLIGAKN